MSENLNALDLKIAEQEKKLKRLKEQKAQAERRAKAEQKKRERADDTRRKILLGALWLEKLKNGTASVEKAKEQLNPFLKRNADRELFGLPPLTTVPKAAQPEQVENSAPQTKLRDDISHLI